MLQQIWLTRKTDFDNRFGISLSALINSQILTFSTSVRTCILQEHYVIVEICVQPVYDANQTVDDVTDPDRYPTVLYLYLVRHYTRMHTVPTIVIGLCLVIWHTIMHPDL